MFAPISEIHFKICDKKKRRFISDALLTFNHSFTADNTLQYNSKTGNEG